MYLWDFLGCRLTPHRRLDGTVFEEECEDLMDSHAHSTHAFVFGDLGICVQILWDIW